MATATKTRTTTTKQAASLPQPQAVPAPGLAQVWTLSEVRSKADGKGGYTGHQSKTLFTGTDSHDAWYTFGARLKQLSDKGFVVAQSTPHANGLQLVHIRPGYRVMLTCSLLTEEQAGLFDTLLEDAVVGLVEVPALNEFPTQRRASQAAALADEDIFTTPRVKAATTTLGWDAVLSAPPVAKLAIPTGTFTIVFDGDDSDYMTLRVREADFNDGPKTVIDYLCGADNDHDFCGFAFLDPQTTRVTVWKRFRDNYDNGRLGRAVAGLLADPLKAGETYAMQSGDCWRCGRKLTVPASLKRGMGPDCAAKMGY